MNKIEKFKIFIRFIVSIFASREFGFIYCVIGTVAQTMHTYYLIESVSSLESGWRIFQAIALSIFISSSLLFFTAIADNDEDSADYKRIHFAVNLFMVIEIIINLYYYAAHLIIGIDTPNWFDFIFATLVSCLIPVTIKLYAGIIQAKEWLESLKDYDKKESEQNITPVDIDYDSIAKASAEICLKGLEEEIGNLETKTNKSIEELKSFVADEISKKLKRIENIEVLISGKPNSTVEEKRVFDSIDEFAENSTK